MSEQDSRAIVLDIAGSLQAFLEDMTRCGDTDREIRANDVFIATLRHIHFCGSIREASGALLNDLCESYFPDIYSSIEGLEEDNKKRLEWFDIKCNEFVREVHNQLVAAGMYNESDELVYTLGGWVQYYSPYMVRTADLNNFSKSFPLVVGSDRDTNSEHRDSTDNPGFWNPSLYLTQKPKY